LYRTKAHEKFSEKVAVGIVRESRKYMIVARKIIKITEFL